MGASSAQTPGQGEIAREMGTNFAAPHAGAASVKSPSEAVARNKAAGAKSPSKAAAADRESALPTEIATAMPPATLQQQRTRQPRPRMRMVPRKSMGQGGAAQKRPRRRRQAKDGEEQQQAKKKRSVDSLAASQAVPTELSCPRLSQQDMRPVALQCHQVAPCTARA